MIHSDMYQLQIQNEERRGEEEGAEKCYKLGKLMRFSKKYVYLLINCRWTQNRWIWTMTSDQTTNGYRKWKTTRLIYILFSFFVQYSLCCCCVCCYFSLNSLVSFLRESFIFKCQTYLPVKYLIYSSVYFNFDLVRAFHLNLTYIFIPSIFLALFRSVFVLNLNILIDMGCIWYQYLVPSIICWSDQHVAHAFMQTTEPKWLIKRFRLMNQSNYFHSNWPINLITSNVFISVSKWLSGCRTNLNFL